jgi:hypothetical protein
MNWRSILAILTIVFLPAGGQTPKRMIDRCAQDGRNFWAPVDGETVAIDWDDVGVRIESGPKGSESVALSFTHEGHKLTQKQDGFEAARGWLVVSPSAFAVTWNLNASASYTQIFNLSPAGEITENTALIRAAQKEFVGDAKRFCRDPGVNTIAIKWIDNDRLLLSIDAWSTGACYSNFTEGFILEVTAGSIERKLTERELIDLPAVCTWNVVPISKKQ